MEKESRTSISGTAIESVLMHRQQARAQRILLCVYSLPLYKLVLHLLDVLLLLLLLLL